MKSYVQTLNPRRIVFSCFKLNILKHIIDIAISAFDQDIESFVVTTNNYMNVIYAKSRVSYETSGFHVQLL